MNVTRLAVVEILKTYLELLAFLDRDSANVQNCPMDIVK